MKKFTLAFAAALMMSCIGLTGCGGGGDSSVVEKDPNATASGMTAEEEQGYEAAMQDRGGPGN